MTQRTASGTHQWSARPVLSATAALIAGLLLAGCSGAPVVEESFAAPATAESSPVADTSAIGGSGGPAPKDPTSTDMKEGTGVANQPPPMLGQGVVTDVPVWDAAAEKAAISVASECLGLFALKDRSAQDWKRTMANGCLTPKAQQAWANVQPDKIPVTEVLAIATLDSDRSNPYWVWATLPTNDGDYRVQLYREGAGKPWLIDLIRPKELKR